ncbi:MAG: FAD binding domain-containing protein [Clostridiales bacterium]|nr:FAD binding domain-containing protein [Clostridiales bacterium]
MLKIREYVKAKDLEEAYQLNQKRSACVLGGMVWLKMGSRNVGTAIDLSGLGLDTIEENEEEFRIGAMVSLRDLEIHKGLAEYTRGAMKESLRHIVGVQFRNCATAGGSIFGRFGFSDVLTMFLAMDSYVELYRGGILPMEEFAKMKRDRDILVRILVKKRPAAMAYISQRNSSTDFPVLACGVSLFEDGETKVTLGACPYKAVLVKDEEGILKDFLTKDSEAQKKAAEAFAAYAREHVPTGSNMRGSAQYRSHLVQVLVKRALIQAGGMKNGN